MEDFQVLIGGKAGDGINSAGLSIAHLLDQMGYRIYMYFDYPSLIKGGHNFALVRASKEKVGAHRTKVDFVLALNPDTVRLHEGRMHEKTVVIYNADNVKADMVKTKGLGIQVKEILDAEKAPEIMGNSCIIGGFAKAAGIEWDIVEAVFRKHFMKATEQNVQVAKRAYESAIECMRISPIDQPKLPVITGNEAIGLGLLDGGLEAYVAYPMTPTSNLLHYMAEVAPDFSLTVVHPENEIAVMLMALGFAYAGKKAAVGTSGGGFCLMTEGLSFSGQAELPVVIILGQRTGPSTGLPTYSAQSDLHFALHAGQGEFPRFIVAPGDAEEAYAWSSVAVGIAWKFQIPAIILGDKTVNEGTYSFDQATIGAHTINQPPMGRAGPEYKRYADTADGISPLLFPSAPDTVVKVNSYAHDKSGITTEEMPLIVLMTEKRVKKEQALESELEKMKLVKVYGKTDASTALLCWGSTKSVCREVASHLGIRVVQPLVLSPFPLVQLAGALKGVTKLIAVEENAQGQLSMLLKRYSLEVQEKILRYDGRPFAVEELEARVKEVLK